MEVLKAILIAAALIVFAGTCHAEVIRATELNSSTWSAFAKGALNDLVVEFRQGDELPFHFSVEGDLIETTQSVPSYIGIKRNFWLKVKSNKILISLDGAAFRGLNEVLTGQLEAGANADQSGGVANAVNVALKAFLK